ncbi:glycosyltransferase family 39 protein [Halovivax sp.]|uniref:ArnT family glycosyltransferase n=1 Tax=Halovivax sp. TaxID=1935978 RepID=UPI0025B9B03B|nr:glycosyltransferase family 39 protein [Halovivax sp.]
MTTDSRTGPGGSVSRVGRGGRRLLAAGALGLACMGLLAPFVEPVGSIYGRELAALTAAAIGATIWTGRDRLRISSRANGGSVETVSEPFPGSRLFANPGRVTGRVRRNPYPLALTALTAAAVVVYGFRLGAHHLYGDEYQVVAAAGGYVQTGEFVRWDWVGNEPRDVYDRAWPHTLLVAVSFQVFGVSEWAARLPSALAGVLTVPLSYYVFRYVTERRAAALLASAALLLYPPVIGLFRWTRMYALVIPLVFLLAYLACRALTERNRLDLRSDRANRLVEEWLDFDLRIGLLALPVLYLGYLIHVNVLFVVAAAYVFVVVQALHTRQRRYATATVLGAAGAVAVAGLVRYAGRLAELAQFLSAFERRNAEYVDFLFQYPVETALGLAVLVGGLAAVGSVRDETLRSKLLFCYVLVAFSFVFAIFVADRYPGFRYIVHVVPFAILLVIYGFLAFVEMFDRGAIRYLLIALLLINLAVPFYAGAEDENYRTLYLEDEQDFETAYGTIEANYDPDEEAIFGQFLRRIYLQNLDEDATVVRMESDRRYAPEEFADDLESHGAGWITWETGKDHHVDPAIREFVDEHFAKHHGAGVDDTGLEVYSFDEETLEDADLDELRASDDGS